MSNIKFIVENGNADGEGNNIKLSGLQIPDEGVLLIKDFDFDNPVGQVHAFIEDGVLKAEGDIPDCLMNAYPAISLIILSKETNEQGGYSVLSATLESISLSDNPNVDPSIKRVSEQ